MRTIYTDDVIKYAHQEKFMGTGLEYDPIILEKFNFQEEYGESVELIGSDIYMKFINVKFHENEGRLFFRKCSNVSFENCSFYHLKLKKCSNVTLDNCEISDLYLDKCKLSNFNQCTAKYFLIYLSFGNKFKECHFDSAVNDHSRGNVFEKGSIITDDYEYFVKGLDMKGLLYASVIFLVLIVSALSFYNYSVILSILGASFLAIGLIYIIFLTIRNRLRARKYLPNLIY
jgi:hypothetical protein